MAQGETRAELSDLIQTTMRELHVPGVAVGVIHDGAEHTAGFGVTNVNHPLPVDADTLFQIGSITKTFVGTLTMRLVERGALDLDRPVIEYLPELRLRDAGAQAGATMRHLLTHTGGWLGDWFDDAGNGDNALAEIVARMADLPQLSPLGELWSYNNAGFYLAGRVIEIVAGKPFETVMRDLVLDPLGMDMTFFFPADVMTRRFAVGHIVRDDEPTVAEPWPLARAAHAAGGIASTVNDMLKYARFQFTDGVAADGTRLLSPESMALMRTPQVAIDSFGNHVGITWMLRAIGNVRAVTHGGGTNGQVSLFLVVPERDFALVVLTNANRGGELTPLVQKWALDRYLGARDPEPIRLEMSATDLQSYAGSYRAALSDIDVRVTNGALAIQVTPHGGFPTIDSPPGPTPPPTRAAFIGPDQLLLLDPPFRDNRAEFLRGSDGAIAWLRFGGRVAALE